MKNEKKMPASKEKQTSTGTKQRSAAGTLVTATSGAAPASKKTRVTAGRGLANEGTATSYDDQNRND